MKAIEKYGGKFLFVPLSPLLAIVVVVVELGDNDSLSTEIVILSLLAVAEIPVNSELVGKAELPQSLLLAGQFL